MPLRCNLTVFFDGQYWVGVFERTEENLLSVCAASEQKGGAPRSSH